MNLNKYQLMLLARMAEVGWSYDQLGEHFGLNRRQVHKAIKAAGKGKR